MNQILNLAHKFDGEGFSDLTEDDVHELIDSNDDEPTNQELMEIAEEMLASTLHSDNDDDVPEEGPSSTITTTFLHTLFKPADNI